MYRHGTTIRMSHTDCAGVMFFPRLLELAHESWEALLTESGIRLWELIQGEGPLLPIVHCEADYRHPMRLGQKITVELSTADRGDRSFRLEYRFVSETGDAIATAQTVHVCVDPASGRATALPAWLSSVLMDL